MADLATLAVQVDSRSVKDADKDLRSFESSAKGAQVAALGMKNALQEARFDTLSAGLRGANDNLKGMAAAQTPLRALSAQLASIATPANLIGVGLSAAAGAAGIFISSVVSGFTQADDSATEHARLMGIVKDAYRDATKEAGEFFKQSKEITLFEEQQNLRRLQDDVRRRSAGAVGSVSSPRNNGLSDMGIVESPMAMTGGIEVSRQFREAEEAIQNFNRSVESGSPEVEKYREELARLGNAVRETNPQLANTIALMLANTRELGEAAVKIAEAEARIRILQGQGTEEDRRRLGLNTPKAKEVNARVGSFDRTTEQIEKRIERMQIEADTFGMTEGAAARYRVQLELLNAAKRDGITLTPEQIAGNERLASAMEAQTSRMEALQQAQERLNIARDATKGFVHDLMNGVSAAEAFHNALQRIAQRLIDMAIDQTFAKAFSGGTGGGGGFNIFSLFAAAKVAHTGGIVGSLPGSDRMVHPAVFAGAPRFHGGGIVGLQPGERPIIAQDGERIIPKGGAMGNVIQNFTVNAPGATPEAMALAFQEIRRLRSEVPKMAVDSVARARELQPGRVR